MKKSFEIPIYIADLQVVPALGSFKRLGMDVVVNAVWLAYHWAVSTVDAPAVSALEKLILDWPMDFILITGATAVEIEEKKFTWVVNMSAKVERLRNFIGLENTNLLRIIMKAADIVKTKGGGNKKPEHGGTALGQLGRPSEEPPRAAID